jgi:large repetitive protein
VVNRSLAPVTYYTVYPNPVQNILTIRINAAASEKIMVEVMDMNGQRIITRSFSIAEGEQSLPLDMSRLGNGTYILKITMGGKVMSKLVNKF